MPELAVATNWLIIIHFPFVLALLQMFGGWNKKYKHQSDTLGCSMTFTVYYPPAAEKGKVPVGISAA